MIAMVDCNNFFVSCERVFRPDLAGKPVVVLSNNDGCIVARSNEVKALGIPMGVPLFKVRDEIEKHGITVFSSNFRLYGDMSDRVMAILARFCDEVDVYSIDEAFLTLPEHMTDALAWGGALRSTILREVGIPVSVGIAPTKTLAKVAGEVAKSAAKAGKGNGVEALTDHEACAQVLATFPAGEVWNIGRQHTRRLVGVGVTTAGQFSALPEHWVQKHMGVFGRRIQEELNGRPCYTEASGVPSKKQSIMSSRSFGSSVTELALLKESVAHHVATASRKLRAQDMRARVLSVALYSRESREAYKVSHRAWRELSFPTSDLRILTREAHALTEQLFQQGTEYKKAGVLLADFVEEGSLQGQTLFGETLDHDQRELMRALDTLNAKYLRRDLVTTAAGLARHQTTWLPKTGQCSPEYTTSWQGIPLCH
jgi:DNA polymerase V